MMTTWTDIKRHWDAGWVDLHRRALATYQAAIETDPRRFAEPVAAFISQLNAARVHLDRIRAYVAELDDKGATEAWKKLELRWRDLAAGLYADARPASEGMGAVPVVVLVVGGLVVGVAAIAWAVAAYQYAVNLREQTELADRELAARIEASREGRQLSPSTLPPPPPDPVKAAKGIGMLLVGGLVVTAGAVLVPAFLKR